MIAALLAHVVRLRHAYRRVEQSAWLAGLAGLGVLPLVLSAPRLAWVQGLCGLLVSVYAIRQGSRAARVRQRVRQLRLEEQFLRSSHEPARLRQYLYQRDHLWTGSRLFQVLRSQSAHPHPEGASLPKQQAFLQDRFRRALTRSGLGALRIDGILLASAAVLFTAFPHLPVASGSLLFLTGLLAGVLALGATLAQVPARLALDRLLDAFTLMLAEWAVNIDLTEAAPDVPAGSYTHTLRYQSPPLSAPGQPAPPETNAGDQE